MSGHSHWATIKHKKGAADAKKGKIFSKVAKLIIQAARHGGGDPDHNIKLYYALDKARACNMPRENIERAIKRGTGEGGDTVMEEITYEGYGPGGVAVIIQALTDNRNRTGPEMRKLFEANGGNLGAAGCVGYLFDTRGVLIIAGAGVNEDALMTVALDQGAQDLRKVEDAFEVICEPHEFDKLRQALTEAKYKIELAEVVKLPKTRMALEPAKSAKVGRLLEALNEHDDVQEVYTNLEEAQPVG